MSKSLLQRCESIARDAATIKQAFLATRCGPVLDCDQQAGAVAAALAAAQARSLAARLRRGQSAPAGAGDRLVGLGWTAWRMALGNVEEGEVKIAMRLDNSCQRLRRSLRRRK